MPHGNAGEKSTGEPAGDLAQLVSVEQALEQRLDQARADARELVASAGRECETLNAAYAAEAASERALLESRVTQERQEQESRILADGRQRAGRYDGLPQTTIGELAEVVLDCLLRSTAE